MKKIILVMLVMMVGSVFGQVPSWAWARSAGPTGNEGYGVAYDGFGNLYAIGGYGPTITFGSTTLTSAGGADGFLVKYDASGNILWARSEGGTGDEQTLALTTDYLGNVYVTGTFTSPTITFGTFTLTLTSGSGVGYCDIFIVKYDPSGNVLWAKSAGGYDQDIGNSIKADATGIYLTGYFYSNAINFSSTVLIHTTGSIVPTFNMFLVKYDFNGNVIWVRKSNGTGNDSGNSVTTDTAGNVFVAGTFSSQTSSYGSVTLLNPDIYGTENAFIIKYDTNGNALWGKNYGSASGTLTSTEGEEGNGVATDATGIYFTGKFDDLFIVVGSDTLFNTGLNKIFVIKYDEIGNVLWDKEERNTNDKGYNVVTDSTGAYVSGMFGSPTITFGTSTFVSPAGATDAMFLVKYDQSGNIVCATILSSGADEPTSSIIAADHLGNLYVSGDFMGNTFILGTDTLHSTSSLVETFFIAKYNCNGEPVTIKESLNKEAITLFPNPASTVFTITSTDKIENVKVFDLLGKIMITEAPNNNQSTININQFSNGIYFAEIKTEKGVVRKKVVKQ
jgi:hypothetical protein